MMQRMLRASRSYVRTQSQFLRNCNEHGEAESFHRHEQCFSAGTHAERCDLQIALPFLSVRSVRLTIGLPFAMTRELCPKPTGLFGGASVGSRAHPMARNESLRRLSSLPTARSDQVRRITRRRQNSSLMMRSGLVSLEARNLEASQEPNRNRRRNILEDVTPRLGIWP
jgi:hypothetical protein